MTGAREPAYVAAGVLLLWAGMTGRPSAQGVLHAVWRVVACLLGVIVVSGGIAAVFTQRSLSSAWHQRRHGGEQEPVPGAAGCLKVLRGTADPP